MPNFSSKLDIAQIWQVAYQSAQKQANKLHIFLWKFCFKYFEKFVPKTLK